MLYWDNNATTALADEVLEAMLPYLREFFYNASSGYSYGRRVQAAIEEARCSIASLTGALPSEIIMTSGATESINTALLGMRRMAGDGGMPVVCLASDHAAALYGAGGQEHVVRCPVDEQGLARVDAWEELVRGKVAGASFTWANNETGVIQQGRTLVEIAHRHGVPVHVDGVQCLGKIPFSIADTGADYASFSAHKLHGPKGAGALYVRAGVRLPWLISGGGQEDGRRGGTENVAGIVGFGAAARLSMEALAKDGGRMRTMRDRFEETVTAALDGVKVLSGNAERIPNTSNVLFEGCTSEALNLLLEPQGMLCSSGSACQTANPDPSHVLLAMGLGDAEARSCMRFSISRYTTMEEVERASVLVIEAVERVRRVQSSRTGPVIVYNP